MPPVVKVALQRVDLAAMLREDPELAVAPAVRALLARPDALKLAVLRRFQPAAVLWQQGDEGDSLWLVLKGSARVLARRDHDSAELGVANKGDVLGEAEVLAGSARRGASVLATGLLEALELPRAALLVNGAMPPLLANELERVHAGRAQRLDDMSDFLNRW